MRIRRPCPLWVDIVQKSFWSDERKFLASLMLFAGGDVRDHIVSSKIDHGLSSGANKRCSSREAPRSAFARFLGLFDFRLLQHGVILEPDKGKGISSPGTYEASLMWPRNDGERQWNTMSDWTCRCGRHRSAWWIGRVGRARGRGRFRS